MRRQNFIFLTVLVIAAVLMSGCINPGSFGAAPVEVPTPPNTTIPPNSTSAPEPATIPAPAVVIRQVPVAAPAPTTIAVSTTPDHISKYADYNPVLSLTHTGAVQIVTGGWGSGASVYINSTESKNIAMVVNVTPDGSSILLPLEPGNYTAILPDKLDNLTEQHDFYVGEKTVTYVAFNGYTYRVSNGEGC